MTTLVNSSTHAMFRLSYSGPGEALTPYVTVLASGFRGKYMDNYPGELMDIRLDLTSQLTERLVTFVISAQVHRNFDSGSRFVGFLVLWN